MTAMPHQVPCPFPDCADVLYINWSASYALYPEEMTPGAPVPQPEDAHANQWEVSCSAGHVLAMPEGDSDHEEFTAADRTRVLTVIGRLIGLPDAPAPEEDPAPAAGRRDLIEEVHGRWTLRIHDDQPIAEGKQYAADSRVEVVHDGAVFKEFFYPGYRIWTLLAHWKDGLDPEGLPETVLAGGSES